MGREDWDESLAVDGHVNKLQMWGPLRTLSCQNRWLLCPEWDPETCGWWLPTPSWEEAEDVSTGCCQSIEHVKCNQCTKFSSGILRFVQIMTKSSFAIMFFFFWLNSRNSLTIVSTHMKLGICTGISQSLGFVQSICIITRVLILIGSTHTFVWNLSSSKWAQIRWDQTYLQNFYVNYYTHSYCWTG